MKQDEFIKEFNDKLNFNCTSLKEVHLKMYASCTPEDIYHFINHLLSKKPSVSDEKIERMAKNAIGKTYCGGIDITDELREAYVNGIKSLHPQVVQSEVSEIKEIDTIWFDVVNDPILFDHNLTWEQHLKHLKSKYIIQKK